MARTRRPASRLLLRSLPSRPRQNPNAHLPHLQKRRIVPSPRRPSARMVTTSSTDRSVPADSSARLPASSRRRSRRPRRVAWCRPSRAPRLPTRPACSISTTESANGPWVTPANRISTSAEILRTPAIPIASSIVELPTRRSFHAATAALLRRYRSAGREFGRATAHMPMKKPRSFGPRGTSSCLNHRDV